MYLEAEKIEIQRPEHQVQDLASLLHLLLLNARGRRGRGLHNHPHVLRDARHAASIFEGEKPHRVNARNGGVRCRDEALDFECARRESCSVYISCDRDSETTSRCLRLRRRLRLRSGWRRCYEPAKEDQNSKYASKCLHAYSPSSKSRTPWI